MFHSCRYLRFLPIVGLLIFFALSSTSAIASPPSNAFRFFHDADGRLKAAIDPEGSTAVYNWDAAGNLLSISRHASSKLSVVQLSPAQGEVGATVTIEGTGFSTTPASNTVKFNGTAATVTAASATSLTVKVPSGATTGSVAVTVGEEGPATSPEGFTVTESSAPKISSISPTLAVAEEEVTISGSNFDPSALGDVITLNRSRPEVVSSSATSIKFKIPPGTLGGHVSVATSAGSSVGPDLFIPPSGTATSKVTSTGRFTLGESVAVSLPAEKAALRLFEGTAGQRISVALSESTVSSGTFSVWSPSGTQVASGSISTSGGFLEIAALPLTGTYTVRLSPSGTSSGAVKLTTYLVEDLSGSITPAATAEGTTQHLAIATPGQNARYSVTMSAGEKVALRTNNSKMSGTYTIKWLNSKGETLYSEWWNAEENWFWDAKTFATAGAYTLLVDPEGATTGSVDLQLWEDPDLTGQTTTPSTKGGSVTSTIKVPGQRELITFAGTKEQRLSWNSAESTITAGGTITLLKPSGAELTNAGFSSFREPVTLPETGTYTFVIDPAATGKNPVANGTGSLKLTAYLVEDLSGSITPEATTAGTTQHVAISTPGQVARYSVAMSAGERVALKTTNTSFSQGFYLKWLNSKEEVLYSEHWNATENWFWNPKTFSAAGTYTLLVDPDTSGTGSVDLKLWEVPPDPTGSIAPTAAGETKTFSLMVPGQRYLVSFAGTAGQTISFQGKEPTIAGGSVSILKPSGAELAGSNGSLTAFVGPLTLPETGTYTFVIDPEKDYTGSLKLTTYLVEDLTGSITPAATAEGTTQHVAIGTPSQNARYSVTMSAGEKVALRTNNSKMSGTYTIKWLNSKGETLYSETWNPEENWFWDAKTFASAGTYTLLLDPSGTTTGSVDLQLWEDPDLTGQTITPSAEGGSAISTIKVPGQRELITFSGTASQLVTVKGTESTIANGKMWVLKPDGTVLAGSEATFSTTTAARKELTLPTTGTYTIVVDPPPTGKNPVTEGTGSVKASVYLGSHAAWFGPIAPTAQLVSYTPASPLQPAGYSDISLRESPPRRVSRAKSASQARGAHSPIPHASNPVRHRRHLGPITPAMKAFHPDASSAWHPPRTSRGAHGWEAGDPKSPWTKIRQLQASPGTTALAGQALAIDGLPVAGVRVSLEGSSASAETDSAGRFLLEAVPAGRQVLVIDGETAAGKERYGTYQSQVDLADHKTTALEYTVWLTPLDKEGDQRIDSPTRKETRLTTPKIPGLEVRIPAGTVIHDAAGNVVKKLNISPIPVDRPPFPLPPFVSVPIYFTVQPGRAYLSKGAQIVYPNWSHMPPGQRVDFWNYDAKDRGWYVYGKGTVTPDGKQVVPDPGVRVWEFTGAMFTNTPSPPGTYPSESGGGDPVDLYSGLFTYHKRDLTVPDTIPIVIERTYRPGDSNSYSFGKGTSSFYDMRMWSEHNYTQADLILPDGRRVHYVRTSSGVGYKDAVYKSTNLPGPFYGSEITWDESVPGWDLKLTSGTTYVFGELAPLQAIKDKYGNTLTISRTNGQTGNITRITSPNGRWVKFSYDASNRITEITDNGGQHLKYEYTSGLLTNVTDPAGRKTEYAYNASGQMTSITDARGNKYLEVAYGANGRVEKQTAASGATFEFSYALNGEGKAESTTLTDPRGSKKKVVFNSEGRTTSETLEPGTEYEETTSFERQSETGLLFSKTDPLGHKTAYEYDSNGNIKGVTLLAGTAEAKTTKYSYEAGTNRLTEEVDPLGHATKYEYGSKGELLKRTDALGHATSFEYNSEGQLTAITNAMSQTTHFGYSHGDLTSITDPLGRTTSRFLDGLGRVQAATSPGGQTTRYAYNEDGQVTSVTSPLGEKTGIEYDADGNPVKLTGPRGGETTFAYDVMDRLVKETDPLEHSAEWSYDKAGDVSEAIDRNGKGTTFSYDPLRRLTLASYGVSGLEAESTIAYEYNGGNQLTHAKDSVGGSYAIKRDPLGRIESVEGPVGTVGYAYDAAGRRESMSVSGLETLSYTYDSANRLTGLTRGAESVGLEYDKANRPTAVTLPDGIKQEYGYDAAGETTSIAYKHSGTTMGAIEYAYDPNGRLEAMWGSYARLNLPEALNTTEYNADNELVKREGAELGYDKQGNLLSDGANEYSWNARGQLSGISGGTTASFGYDPFGRRTSKTLGGTTTELLYDEANVALEKSGGATTASLIAGLQPDQLFARTTASGAASYLTDRLGSTVALANGSAEVTTAYSYDPFGASTSTGEASTNPYQFTGRENDGTGLQFNRARYYSYGMGRFVSQDPAGFAGSGSDLYWYAYGDPLGFRDPSGRCPIWELCVPDPIGELESAAHTIGHWITGAPGVASEAAEGVESVENSIGNGVTQFFEIHSHTESCPGRLATINLLTGCPEEEEETGSPEDGEQPYEKGPGAPTFPIDPQHPVPVEPDTPPAPVQVTPEPIYP